MKTVISNYYMSDKSFAKVAGDIFTGMNANTAFSNLQRDVDAIKPVLDDYMKLWQEATITRSKETISQRIAVRTDLTTRLKALGASVNAAGATTAQLSTTGFRFAKTKQTSPSLTAPASPIVSPGVNRGEIICKSKRQKGMISFTYFITEDLATGKWESYVDSRKTFVFAGLKSNTRYFIRYAVSGPRRQIVMSDIVSYTAQ